MLAVVGPLPPEEYPSVAELNPGLNIYELRGIEDLAALIWTCPHEAATLDDGEWRQMVRPNNRGAKSVLVIIAAERVGNEQTIDRMLDHCIRYPPDQMFISLSSDVELRILPLRETA